MTQSQMFVLKVECEGTEALSGHITTHWVGGRVKNTNTLKFLLGGIVPKNEALCRTKTRGL